jgi:hypothetical protein
MISISLAHPTDKFSRMTVTEFVVIFRKFLWEIIYYKFEVFPLLSRNKVQLILVISCEVAISLNPGSAFNHS